MQAPHRLLLRYLLFRLKELRGHHIFLKMFPERMWDNWKLLVFKKRVQNTKIHPGYPKIHNLFL